MKDLFSQRNKSANYLSLGEENVRQTARLVIFQCFIVTSVMNLIFYHFDYAFLADLMVICSSIHLTCFLLLKKKMRLMPRMISYFAGNISVLLTSISMGFEAHIWLYFFPAVSIPILFFNTNEKTKRFILALVPCVCLCIAFAESHVADFDFTWVPHHKAPSSELFSLFVMVSALVLQITLICAFNSRQFRAQRFLENQKASLIQQEKMQALGTLASGISHEINNSLASLQLYFDLLERKLKESNPTDERIQNSAERISLIIKRIASIVLSLRIYAHGDSSSMDIVSLESAVADSTLLLKSKIAVNKTPIELIESENKLHVFCNHSHLLQILMSLLSNAIDATAGQDKPWIKIEAQKIESEILIRVVDSGTGIPKAILAKMFEPFFTTKPVGQGTGLGISIAQSLAQANGGKIYYEKFNGHTSFVLHLKSPHFSLDTDEEVDRGNATA